MTDLCVHWRTDAAATVTRLRYGFDSLWRPDPAVARRIVDRVAAGVDVTHVVDHKAVHPPVAVHAGPPEPDTFPVRALHAWAADVRTRRRGKTAGGDPGLHRIAAAADRAFEDAWQDRPPSDDDSEPGSVAWDRAVDEVWRAAVGIAADLLDQHGPDAFDYSQDVPAGPGPFVTRLVAVAAGHAPPGWTADLTVPTRPRDDPDAIWHGWLPDDETGVLRRFVPHARAVAAAVDHDPGLLAAIHHADPDLVADAFSDPDDPVGRVAEHARRAGPRAW